MHLWGGKIGESRWWYIVVLPAKWKAYAGMTPEEELNDVIEKLDGALRNAGVGMIRNDGKMFYEWMLSWFNPRPQVTGETERSFSTGRLSGDTDLPVRR